MKRLPPKLALWLAVATLLTLSLQPALAQEKPDALDSPRLYAPVQGGQSRTAESVLPYATDRIMVKFSPSALNKARLNVTMKRGASAVRPVTGLKSVDALCREAGILRISRPYNQPRNRKLADQVGVERWFMFHLPAESDVRAIADRFAADPGIEYATPDYRAFPAVVPSDPLYNLQWGHNNTAQMLSYDWATHSHENGSPVGTVGFDANAETAWNGSQGYGDSGVVIAILDSGVDIDHPDLRLVAGYDYGDNDSNPDDNSSSPGHGTACAGVAAAIASNSLGVSGIAGGCSVMPLKVANSAGDIYFSALQNAIYHAADNGADVISMSLGAAISSDPGTDSAIQYAYNAGLTILAATGNENASTISYPAIHSLVIGVGAASPCGERKRSSSNSGEVNPGVNTDPNGYTCDGERWWGSNYGVNSQDASGAVDVIAPTIMPTTDIGAGGGYDSSDYYKWFNGTSCATPYAAGVCGLIISANPGWTPAQVRDQLVNTAEDVTSVESGSGWDRYAGYGMVDAEAAVGGGGPSDTITVTAPNGGEVLDAGTVFTITWTSTGSIANVAIDYSTNGGSSWTAITSSTTNDGSYNWTVPADATTLGRVRIADASNATVNDTSNGNFTINVPSSYTTLPYTTGFESGALDQYWTTSSTANGEVFLSTANTPHGGSYHLIMDAVTNGTYATNTAWLHLDLSGETNVDLNFWWKEFGDETHSQDGVYFSDDGGSSFVKVQDLGGSQYANNTWNSFSLDLDALASSNGLSLSSTFVVQFQQYDNYHWTTDGHAFDDIEVTGSVPPTPTVTVITPNGGEILTAGNVYTITWTSTGSITNVAIDYSTNGGSSWTAITSSTPNDGSYNWTVPSEATTQGRVRVQDTADPGVTDTSDANFTIDIPTGDYATLPYTTGFESGALDQYWITYSTEDGRIRVLSTNTPHSGSYHMTMDDATSGGYSTNEAWLHLNLSGETNVDLNFWWKEFGDETHSQDGVYFSDDGGTSFVMVQTLGGSQYVNNTWNSFGLDLDALAASNGLSLSSTFVVKFEQYDNYPMTSDGHAFDDIEVIGGTPPTPTVTVTAPNGGEVLTATSVYTITWSSTGAVGDVALDYSTNGGSNWTAITSSTANDGSYDWTVPSEATTQGRVRVQDAADPGVTDTSDGNFTINIPSGNYATLPYTTGFESGALDQYWITYSTGDGRIRVLSTNTPHSGTYHLTMDDATSGGYSTNEAWLHLDLSGETDVDLDFWWKEFGDETHSQDGVYFSDDGGTSFVMVQTLGGSQYVNNTWNSFSLDLDALAGSNGLTLSSTFVVKFEQYDNYPMTSDGHAFDDISVTAVGGGPTYITSETEPNDSSGSSNGPVGTGVSVSGSISSSSDEDWFYFDVNTAGNVNIELAIGSSADLDWFLYDSGLTEVARGYTTNNPEAGSYTAATGHYYLMVNGYLGATSSYTLTITGGLAKFLDLPQTPKHYSLHQNFPNPFNPVTTVKFDLPREGNVKLRIYDQRGRAVATLVNGFMKAGRYGLKWDGRDDSGRRVASGIYVYRIEARGFMSTKKMTLLK